MNDVNKELPGISIDDLKAVINLSIKENMEEVSKVSFIERQKNIRSEMFRNTERLLYSFSALEIHLKNEKEYLEMAFKNSSGSIIKYSKNKVEKPEDDQLLADRKKSYERSLHDYNRLKEALDLVSHRKGFGVIQLKYLSGENYTHEEIAEKLAGTEGFSENLSEKTVGRYKNILVNEIALYLFGTDAL